MNYIEVIKEFEKQATSYSGSKYGIPIKNIRMNT